jgi:hypothetical protein
MAAVLVAGAIVPALAAGASPRVPVLFDDFDLPADFCGFPVHVSSPVNNEFANKFTTNADGTTSIHITGRFYVGFTNLDSGKSVVYNVSGPGTFTVRQDNTFVVMEGEGRGFAIFAPAAQAAFGVPGIAVVSGHAVTTFAADGSVTSFSFSGGRPTDACAAIA